MGTGAIGHSRFFSIGLFLVITLTYISLFDIFIWASHDNFQKTYFYCFNKLIFNQPTAKPTISLPLYYRRWVRLRLYCTPFFVVGVILLVTLWPSFITREFLRYLMFAGLAFAMVCNLGIFGLSWATGRLKKAWQDEHARRFPSAHAKLQALHRGNMAIPGQEGDNAPNI